jgi:hypothetical protein
MSYVKEFDFEKKHKFWLKAIHEMILEAIFSLVKSYKRYMQLRTGHTNFYASFSLLPSIMKWSLKLTVD